MNSASTQQLPIAQHLHIEPMRIGTGFTAHGIRADASVLDPYLMADHFWMSEPTFGPHPHAGFSAVTYLFDDCQTQVFSRDTSTPNQNPHVIDPGGSHWFVAGSGAVHDEIPMQLGKPGHGLQLFVNLAAARKSIAPHSVSIAPKTMPVLAHATGATVKIGFGQFEGHTVGAIPSDATLLDIQIQAGGRFCYEQAPGKTALLIPVSGTVHTSGQDLSLGQAIAYERTGGMIDIYAQQNAQVVLLLGQPFNEPVVQHGPFALSTREQLIAAIHAYQAGQMGQLQDIDPASISKYLA